MNTPEKPEVFGHNITLVGELNPKIFQPSWFASANLIRKSEADQADIQIIQNEIISFQAEWLILQVTRGRIIFRTMEESHFEVLRDLVVGTFKLLEHTPLRMLGINWDMHFRKKNQEECNQIGDRLAPKVPWDEILENPELSSLSMQSQGRPDQFKGKITFKVEPSTRIDSGVFVSLNDHFEVGDPKSIVGCKEIIEILLSSWVSSKERTLFAGHKMTET